ncbi:hypothetical protein FK530_23870 [Tsukamurella conjunctivitidis]|uniref:Uncharacterized protein n=1 Tax=Tsukamurella conjunctivitidis TaxID=2592068 RepID=A0A5C5RR21_9ACTN|nr:MULTISPECIES: hypothetical protein [Tsukamurella]TWS24575.1 hypothetical protein FK530_23870 [Tsukamurella conjunctivitidis]
MAARMGRPPKGDGDRTVVTSYMATKQKTALTALKAQYGFTQLSPFIEEILAGVVRGDIDISSLRQPALQLDLSGKGYRAAS